MGLPFALSFFWSVASAGLYHIRGVAKIFLFAGLFGALEWLRGHLFTGFPWNLLGYIWVDTLPVLQSVSLVGIYGLTLYTFLIAGLPYLFLSGEPLSKVSKIAGLLIIFSFGGSVLWGYDRLQEKSVPTDTVVRLVQPNIKQTDKWRPELMDQHFETLVELSSMPSSKLPSATQPHSRAKSPSVILWPETAIAFFDTVSLRRFEAEISNFVPEEGVLITGILDFGRGAQGETKMFNRLSVFNNQAAVIETYDKHHLVPFGEYLPFEKYLPFNPIASNGQSFTRGRGVRTIWLDGIPQFSPLICYEAIFPGAVAETMIDAPAWLLNITNDGWYGTTTGPFQHLAITQTRAVEEGVPLVRVANTGISAMVDSYGQLVDKIPLETKGVIDVALPSTASTLYAVFGDVLFFVMVFVTGAFGFVFQRLQKN